MADEWQMPVGLLVIQPLPPFSSISLYFSVDRVTIPEYKKADLLLLPPTVGDIDGSKLPGLTHDATVLLIALITFFFYTFGCNIPPL